MSSSALSQRPSQPIRPSIGVWTLLVGGSCCLSLGLLASSCGSPGSGAKELPPAPKPVDPAAGQRPLISLEDTVGLGRDVRFAGPLEAWRWAENGRDLVRGTGDEAAHLSAPELQPIEEPMDTPAQDSAEERILEAIAAELAQINGLDLEGAQALARRPRVVSADGHVRVFEHAGALFAFTPDGVGRTLVGAGSTAPELLDLSPDGTKLAFVRDRDLFVVPIAEGTPLAITTDADPDQYDGILDWVYQEEIYGRGNFKAFWWNPSSTHIAFLSLDESDVFEFTVIDHIAPDNFRVTPEVTHYPKAGDPNPVVKLGLFDTRTGQLRWQDLAQYGHSQPLIVRVEWTPDGQTLLYTVQDRVQTWAELVAQDVESGQREVWIREESSSWVNRPRPLRWLEDGTFLYESERDGYRHIYHHAQGGELLAQITRGEWEVRRILRVDEDRQNLWFTASRDGAIDENVYSIRFDGSDLLRLTQGPGTHRVRPNHDGSLFLDSVSTRTRPPQIRLCDGTSGRVLRILATSEPAPLDAPRRALWETHEVPARDGFPLDVSVLKPLDFNPKANYPVWLMTYSGPNAPTIRNAWGPSRWAQFLAQEGVIVLNVNVRSASRKGHAIISTCYSQLLVQELMDLEDAVDWLTANPWADGTRVGITGWSYGGSMTAYALTNSDRFALGIAGAGVYDWRMYDTIYTERYMNTPQANPEGYRRSSVLASAGGLRGHLLLQHGTMDDNVHLQNTIQLLWALQEAGQTDFELMLYPENRHGLRGESQRLEKRRREWSTIQRYLSPGT